MTSALTVCNKNTFLHFFIGEEYVKSLIANPELVDRLALSSDDKVSQNCYIQKSGVCT